MLDVVRIAPGLLGVLCDLGRNGSPQQVLAARRSFAPLQLPPDRVIPAVDRAARLLGPMIGRHRAGPCVVRSLTAFRYVAGPDREVEWVLGFRGIDAAAGRTGIGHAWVELAGTALPHSNDHDASRIYVEAQRVNRETLLPV